MKLWTDSTKQKLRRNPTLDKKGNKETVKNGKTKSSCWKSRKNGSVKKRSENKLMQNLGILSQISSPTHCELNINILGATTDLWRQATWKQTKTMMAMIPMTLCNYFSVPLYFWGEYTMLYWPPAFFLLPTGNLNVLSCWKTNSLGLEDSRSFRRSFIKCRTWWEIILISLIKYHSYIQAF